ncbi:MAG TPA: hypothetical protein VGU02_05035 [Gaiellaceae bacterium]|nr:hypothetical protein [Gaiellaceae bacterium]
MMLFVVCACASLAGGAATATATTAPGTTATVPVKLTNSTIKVAPDVFTEISSPKVARYPRGATIVFKITNNGTAPLTLRLRLLTKLHVYGSKYLKPTESTKPIAPHGTTKLKATFAFRGNYQFELLRGGKIVAKNAIFIF